MSLKKIVYDERRKKSKQDKQEKKKENEFIYIYI